MTSRPSPLRASRDRWLVSYADFVTILLACFAATYAASQAPQAATTSAPIVKPATPERPKRESPVTRRPSLRDAVAPLVAANASSDIALIDDARGVVISLPESASFPTGTAVLTPTARAFLRDLASSLQATTAVVRVEGHTDDVPVAGGRYGSNWELSTARASAVVAFLINDGALAADRLSAAGYAEFHPRVANDSPENRSLNRRVDVVLMEPER